MSCDVGELTERLENELCCISLYLSITSPTFQLILQPFRCFTYITAHSPTLLLLHLCHSSFSNPSFASSMSQVLHLIHQASHPCSRTWSIGVGMFHRPVLKAVPHHRYIVTNMCSNPSKYPSSFPQAYNATLFKCLKLFTWSKYSSAEHGCTLE